VLSRNIYNQRIRGIKILREVYDTNTFIWKRPSGKKPFVLSESFESIIAGITDINDSDRVTQSIVRYFLKLLTELGIHDISKVKAEHIQIFLSNIYHSWAKSMGNVVTSLRKLDRYLTKLGMQGLPYAGLLMAPRAREQNIYPCMSQSDLNLIIKSIDRNKANGKRDYAILMLAVSSDMRTGDIAKIKRSDIDWRKDEIHIVQEKTQIPINLPLQKNVGLALADYILNGRPESKSPQIFIRSVAPYQNFKSGVAVAGILHRRMETTGVSHKFGDGKTMHGIRRMLGTQMTMEGVPITTVSQILGQQRLGAAKPYISLNIESLRECALEFSSIEEEPK